MSPRLTLVSTVIHAPPEESATKVTTIILPRSHGIYTGAAGKPAARAWGPTSSYAPLSGLVRPGGYRYIRSSVPTTLPRRRKSRGTRLLTAQVSS